jgi:NAD(P)H-hydrate epimerase
MKIVTVEEMLAIERAADAAGHSYAAMMEHAGRGLAEVIHRRYGENTNRRLLALIGKGNNGGDALVALDYLGRYGWTGTFVTAGRPADELVARAQAAGWAQIEWTASVTSELPRLLTWADVLMDGILGTGIRLPLRPPAADLLRAVRPLLRIRAPGWTAEAALESHSAVVAVDTPSGVDCDTGEAAGETLPAQLTVTMAAAKIGFTRFPAFELIGDLEVVDIGLPPDLPEWEAVSLRMLSRETIKGWLPDRPNDGHKGTFGTAWVVAGSERYPGAALLAARAAFASGAGLLATACPASVYRILAGHFPESTWLPLPEEEGALAAEGAGILLGAMDRADSLLAGPGFGRAAPAREFLEKLVSEAVSLPPLVLDADGLRLVSKLDGWPRRLPAETILTPHPGEMAELTGLDAAEIQADRVRTAERYAAEWGHVVVLKGACTVVAAPDGRASIVPVATASLARAGTGDVLAGVITGLLAQGLRPYEAAAAGAFVHGLAGVRASYAIGDPASVLASDVIREIPRVFSKIKRRR